jgi:hypothetical protein
MIQHTGEVKPKALPHKQLSSTVAFRRLRSAVGQIDRNAVWGRVL